MGFFNFIGKLLLVSSIVFQAFLLYQDKKEGDQFNKNLNGAIAQCHCLASIKQHLKQHLRLVVAGLLASSALIVLVKHWTLKLPVLLGLSVLLWVQHHGLCHKLSTFSVSLQILDNVALWHSLGVIGAIIYLLGAECGSCNKQKGAKAESSPKAAESSPDKSKSPQLTESKRKPKKN